jgi:hypothetical protein
MFRPEPGVTYDMGEVFGASLLPDPDHLWRHANGEHQLRRGCGPRRPPRARPCDRREGHPGGVEKHWRPRLSTGKDRTACQPPVAASDVIPHPRSSSPSSVRSSPRSLELTARSTVRRGQAQTRL